MNTLAIILARAGSKGLPGKNVLPLAGRPMVAWSIEHARQSKRVGAVVLSTDGDAIAQVGRDIGIQVIQRPAELAHDTASVADAARHALITMEARSRNSFDGGVVILYGNVPIRPADLCDRALEKLQTTGCDSVQSLCAVGKMHPYWMRKLTGQDGDQMEPFIANNIDRRQDLPPVYMLDGGIIAVRRQCLLESAGGHPHAFLGSDRRAIITQPGEVVDVDTKLDWHLAQAVMQERGHIRS
ncbi:MAG: acylneuraminate cytidylyltransferase family protein [Phycisphaerales bacterium]|nr:acylneuraminate cytidylyltransferase family protein [Phycisphaerales bacterium]